MQSYQLFNQLFQNWNDQLSFSGRFRAYLKIVN